MFKFRPDGRQIKVDYPIDKIVPYIMKTRNDACNFCDVDIECEEIDAWIKKQREEKNISFNYMHLMIAGLVRLVAQRQKLNRFVVGGRIFQRYGLYISLTFKERLDEDSPDITIKMRFTGRENIYQVKDIVDNSIADAYKSTAKQNKTTKVAKILTTIPNWLIGFAVGFVKFLDRFGLLPKKVLDLSPFHTTIYLTNLKSIKGDAIFHHLYNFGTTGIFIAMGKEVKKPVVGVKDNIEIKKVMPIGCVLDERFCDGFYYVKSIRDLKKFLADPSVLEQELDIEPFESKKERKKRLKKED